jgi:trans-aconitate methyltransferase
MKLTRELIVDCYKGLLGREPESEHPIHVALGSGQTLDAYIRSIRGSAEYLGLSSVVTGTAQIRRGVDGPIELQGRPEQLEALRAMVREVWTRYGQTDPHWSVMTNEAFRAQAFTPAAKEIFYQSGAAEAKCFVDACARAGINVPSSASVLDLGCGVGRVGEHLSAHSPNYVGVDISAPHLELARSRFTELRRARSSFLLLNDFLTSTSRFDIFFSIIVLQHNPPPIIVEILDRVLQRLNPGGVAYFQVPTTLYGYSFRLGAYLADKGPRAMEMHAVPQHAVLALLAKHNLTPKEVIMDGKCGPIGISHTFVAQKAR